jgi:hypothetical protein
MPEFEPFDVCAAPPPPTIIFNVCPPVTGTAVPDLTPPAPPPPDDPPPPPATIKYSTDVTPVGGVQEVELVNITKALAFCCSLRPIPNPYTLNDPELNVDKIGIFNLIQIKY